MGWFTEKQTLKTVAAGEIVPLEAVADEVFATKLMGEGFAVANHDGKIYAPASGTVKNIFPTKHALTLESVNGTQILIHMGLDTVELKGLPFSIMVKEGQQVKSDTLLAEMDFTKLADKDATVVVVIPELKKGQLTKQGKVSLQDTVFKF